MANILLQLIELIKNSAICESLKLTLVIRRVFLIGFEIVLIGKNNLWLSK